MEGNVVRNLKKSNTVKVKTKKNKTSKWIEEREREIEGGREREGEGEREKIDVGWGKKAVLLMRTESILEALRDNNLDLFLSCLRSVAQLNE